MEAVVVMVLFGAVLSISLSRLRISEEREIEMAAAELVRLLDMSRAKSIASRSSIAITFDEINASFTAYLDHDRDGTIAKSNTEVDAFGAFGKRKLRSGTRFGRGAADPFPSDTLSGAVTLPSDELRLDSRGVPTPLGTSGVIYVRHNRDENVVAAVTVTGSASFRLWRFIDGAWQ